MTKQPKAFRFVPNAQSKHRRVVLLPVVRNAQPKLYVVVRQFEGRLSNLWLYVSEVDANGVAADYAQDPAEALPMVWERVITVTQHLRAVGCKFKELPW